MFGNDGLERLNRTLKQQVADRDGRLSALQEDVRKKDSMYSNAVKTADSERERAKIEEDRAEKAEAALKDAQKEIAQSRLNVSNYEARLRSEADTVKSKDREIKRLEYELDCISSASANSTNAAQDYSKLVAKLKSTEQEVQRLQVDLTNARMGVSKNIKAAAGTDFFGAPDSPVPSHQGRNRRRASSVNNSGHIKDLQSELDGTRESHRTALEQAETLRSQLVNARREHDKVVNEKMALEKRSTTEIDNLRSQLDDITSELEEVRRIDNELTNSNEQLDNLRVQLEIERDMRKKEEAAAKSIARRSDEQLENLRVELETERDLRKMEEETAQSIASRAAAEYEFALSALEARNVDFEEKLAELQSTIDNAPVSAPLSASAPDNKTFNLVTNAIQRLRHERDELKGQLSFVQHERHFAIQAAKADHASTIEALKQAQIDLCDKTKQLDALQNEKDLLETSLSAAVADVNAAAKLAASNATERENEAGQLAHIKNELEQVGHERDEAQCLTTDLSTKLATVENTLTETLERLDAVQSDLVAVREREEIIQREAEAKIQLMVDAAVGTENAESFVTEEKLVTENKELSAKIDRRDQRLKYLMTDFNKMKLNRDVAVDDLENLKEEIDAVKAENNEIKLDMEKLKAEIKLRSDALDEVRGQLAESAERMAGLQAVKLEQMDLMDDHGALVSQHDLLKAQYAALQIESDAKQKSHEVIQVEHVSSLADQESLRLTLQALQADRDSLATEVEHLKTAVNAVNIELGNAQSQLTASENRAALLESETAGAHELAHSLNSATEIRSLVLALAVQNKALSAATAGARQSAISLRDTKAKVNALEQERLSLIDMCEQAARLRGELEETKVAQSETELRLSTTQQEIASLAMTHQVTRIELEQKLEAEKIRLADATEKQSSLSTAHNEEVALLESKLAAIGDELRQNSVHAESCVAAKQAELVILSTRIDSLNGELEHARGELTLAKARNAELEMMTSEVDSLRAEVCRLELENSATIKGNDIWNTRLTGLEAELEATKTDLSLSSEQEAHLRDQLAQVEAAHLALSVELKDSYSAFDQAKIEAETSGQENKRIVSLLDILEQQKEELTLRIGDLEDEIRSKQEATRKVQDCIKVKEAEMAQMAKENETLKEATTNLREDLDRAMDSLTSKTLEVDEADDRALELNKEIAKLRKRAEKLDRQNKSLSSELETARNTRLNKSPVKSSSIASQSPVNVKIKTKSPMEVMAPPPFPTSRVASIASPASGSTLASRAPLRQFNVFDTQGQNTPSGGRMKRGRDEEVILKPVIAEARMQAPSTDFTSSALASEKKLTTPARSVFAVMAARGAENAPPPGSAQRNNVLASARKNVFANGGNGGMVRNANETPRAL